LAPGSWAAVDDALAAGGPPLLLALRALLVSVTGDATVRLLADLPPAWRGQSLDVHDAPTPLGPVSYALRWHGERPALLWDVPTGVMVTAPGLDPSWCSTEAQGDALLGEVTLLR
jgi:hypothetical protein